MIRQITVAVIHAAAIFLAVHITTGRPTAAAAEASVVGDVWNAKAGRQVLVKAPRITLSDPLARGNWSVKLGPAKRRTKAGVETLEYSIVLDNKAGKRPSITGLVRLELTASDKADDDALLCRSDVRFEQPVEVDVTIEYAYELSGPCPDNVCMPERSGKAAVQRLRPGVAESGKFELGAGAAGAGRDLGMPLVDLCWNRAEAGQNRLRLAVAADPYCGCSISAEALPEQTPPLTRVSIATTYTGSIVPLTSEKRTMSLEFHRRGVDGSFRSFYRTIPEIEPGPAWTQGVNLVYYDYLSEHGEGWFKDLQALADRIPQKHRGRVAVCLHGWYDYFQQYAYDHQRKQLLKEWTAFPSTYKVPMSLGNMHKRLKFAKELGFRVLLYFF